MNRRWLERHRGGPTAAAVLLAGCGLLRAVADGPLAGRDEPWEVTTGALVPLTTTDVPLDAALARFPGTIGLEFVFSTREVPVPNALFDSLTVSLVGNGAGQVATLFTADATGLNLAPATPGGLAFDAGAIRLLPLPSSGSFLADAAVAYAYRADVALPAWAGTGAWSVRFDVFDNGDTVASRSRVQLASVPEPGAWALMATGAALGVAWRRQTRRDPA